MPHIDYVWTPIHFLSNESHRLTHEVKTYGAPSGLQIFLDWVYHANSASATFTYGIQIPVNWVALKAEIVCSCTEPGTYPKSFKPGRMCDGECRSPASSRRRDSIQTAELKEYTIKISLDVGQIVVGLHVVQQEIEALADLHRSQHSNNVELYFPRENTSLWANSTVLATASTFFASMFASGLAEATASTSTSCKHSILLTSEGTETKIQAESVDYADSNVSDCESGSTERAMSHANSPSKHNCEALVHRVKVHDTSPKTYLAVLHWIYSNQITFAPLKSTGRQPFTGNPLATSPKSVYRLANYLGLEKLKMLALNNSESQLTTHNVAEEMFSNMCGVHEVFRKVAIDFAFDNWDEVKSSAGLLKIYDEVSAGNVPYAGVVGADLLKRF